MRPIFRPDPKLPVQAMKTYEIIAPPATHFRKGTCEEAGCVNYQNGWLTKVDETTDLGKQQAYYIRNNAGRKYKEKREAGITSFYFYSEQRCFTNHQVRLDRPEIYVTRGGDFRGNPRGDHFRHANGEDWVDDFKNHQDKLNTEIQKG